MTTQNNPTTVTLELDFSYWRFRGQRAHLKIKSPSGKTLRIYRQLRTGYTFTQEEQQLWEDLSFGVRKEYTKAEMHRMVSMAEKTYIKF